jgi:methionine sulfoxide reductase heme-binding subunit
VSGVLATTGPTASWYLSRGSGIVALLLLTVGLVLGVMGPARFRAPRWPRFAIAGLHRNVTLLAVAFVALHVVTTVADGFAPIGLRDGIVPFLSPYRTLWLGLGTVAFDLLLALVVTSLMRRRIGLRAWRAVHWLAYASWPVAMLHSLGTGTDARLGWMAVLAAACGVAVVAAGVWRLWFAETSLPTRATAVVTVAVLTVLGIGWYHGGPLQHGWARRAGTPATLLGSRVRPTRATALATLPSPPYSAPLDGRVAQAGPDSSGLVSVSIGAITRGNVAAQLRLDLWGLPLEGGGVEMRASQARFGPPGEPAAYTGRIVGLDGNRVLLGLRNAAGRSLSLALVLRIDSGSGQVSGLLRADPGAQGGETG